MNPDFRSPLARWADTVCATLVLVAVAMTWAFLAFPSSDADRVMEETSRLEETYDRAASLSTSGKITTATNEVEQQHDRVVRAEYDYLGRDRSRQLNDIEGYEAACARVQRARERYERSRFSAE